MIRYTPPGIHCGHAPERVTNVVPYVRQKWRPPLCTYMLTGICFLRLRSTLPTLLDSSDVFTASAMQLTTKLPCGKNAITTLDTSGFICLHKRLSRLLKKRSPVPVGGWSHHMISHSQNRYRAREKYTEASVSVCRATRQLIQNVTHEALGRILRYPRDTGTT